MNISWLTLRDLEYLAAVAQFEHFGKAAENCHVSQPTLSAQIKKIESILCVTLFERSNRKVAITDVGRRIAAQAQTVLEEARKIPSLLGKENPPLSSTLRLGAIATLGPYYIPHFLGPLRKAYPHLNLILREGLTEELLQELREGQLDAVLAARTFREKEGEFKILPLFFEPFVLATPRNHPLAKKKPITSTDLRGSDMVLLEDGHCLRDQTLELCPANRRGNIRQYHATSIETLRHLVASGLGYTLFPKLAIPSENALKDLVLYREFDSNSKSAIGREIILVCRARYPNMRDIESLAQFLAQHRPRGTGGFYARTSSSF